MLSSTHSGAAPPWEAAAPDAERSLLKPATLALALLAVAFFPRVLSAAGAPSAINFAHFALAAASVPLVLAQIRTRFAQQLLLCSLALLAVILCSALLNAAGVINVALDFLLLAEPFLLLCLLFARPLPHMEFLRFRQALVLFAALHVALALVQALVLGHVNDDVKGVFLNQGTGHHVGGAIGLTLAAYAVFGSAPGSLVWRAALALGGVAVTVLSDSKQVVAAFLVAGGGLALLRVHSPARLVLYLSAIPLALAVLWLTRDSFPLLNMVMEPWRLEGGLTQKLSVGPVLAENFASPAHWFLGLGPGHTVGRLADMYPDYQHLLDPLGGTHTALTEELRVSSLTNYFSATHTGSSVWSPLFFWAGLFGDLGFLGVCAYVLPALLVWRHLCTTELSRFLLLTMGVFGATFSWLEEPGYTLFVLSIIAVEGTRPVLDPRTMSTSDRSQGPVELRLSAERM